MWGKGDGKIYKQGLHGVRLQVVSVQEFEVLIKHFDKYPLITQKKKNDPIIL